MNAESDADGNRLGPADPPGAANQGAAESRADRPTEGGVVEPSSWISHWAVDLLLIVAVPAWLIPLVLWVEGQASATTGWLWLLGIAVVGHHVGGWWRIVQQAELRDKYRIRLTVGPPLLILIAAGLAWFHLQTLLLVLLAWAFWHAVTQIYGLMRVYDAKVGCHHRVTTLLDKLVCLVWFGAGVLFSADRLEYLLRAYYELGGPLLAPLWIIGLQVAVGLLTAVVSVAFLVRYIQGRMRGESASPIKLLLMATSIGCWWYAMAGSDSLFWGVLVFELFHAIQYTAVSWISRSVKASVGTAEEGDRGQFLGRGRWAAGLLIFLAAIVLYGLPAGWVFVEPIGFHVTADVPLWQRLVAGAVAASALVHFYVNSFLWRLRDRSVRRSLGLSVLPDGAAGTRLSRWDLGHVCQWGCVLVATGGLVYLETGQDGPRAGMNENLVESIPSSWHAHYAFAGELLEGGQLSQAVEQLVAALDLRPDSAQCFLRMGQALRSAGQPAAAVSAFEKAVEFKPDWAVAHAERGKTLFGIGRKDKGLAELRRATALDGRNAEFEYELGLALAKSGKLDEALEVLDRAISYRPSWAEAYNARGNVRWNLKDIQAALDDLDRAIQLDEGLSKAYRNRAGIWITITEPERAIADLSKAIELDGTRSRDYVLRGDMHYAQRRFEQARDDYFEAVKREADYLDPLDRLVGLLTSCPDPQFRNPDRAVSLARVACQETSFRNPQAIRLLSEGYVAMKNYDQAIHWLERVLELTPDAERAEVQRRIEQLKQAKDGS